MITTVTLNPALDRTVFVKSFEKGGHNRCENSRVDLGGKGINVSRVLHQMGIRQQALCLDRSESGSLLGDMLSELGIENVLCFAPGRIRENLKMYDPCDGTMTEINEQGCPVDGDAAQRFMGIFEEKLNETDVLALCGSIPPGMGEDLYRKMILQAREKKICVVLDAAGEALRLALDAKPDVIKPNRYEMELLSGKKIDSLQAAQALCEEIVRAGVGAVCLSLGEEGALYVDGREAWFSPPFRGEIRGLQGAGDSMTAGLCIARVHHDSPCDTLRRATALAHASIQLSGTQLCTLPMYLDALQNVSVSKL